MRAKPDRNDVISRLTVIPPAGPEAQRQAEAEAQPSLRKPESGSPSAAQEGAKAASGPRGNRKIWIVGTLAAMLLVTVGYFGVHYWLVGRFQVSTDDAYVRANTTTLAAKVPGYVAQILVADNAQVHAGDVIARIDNGDFVLAANSAREKAASQQASIDRIGRQVTAQQAIVAQTKAQLASAQAAAVRGQSELERQQALASKDFASKQALETAQANRDQAAAAVASAQAAIQAAEANVDVLKAQQNEAARGLDELRTALAKAERDLSFTDIRAPIDGIVGNRAMQPGDYVQTGQRLASLVPLDRIYIDANFKETQLARLQPGQKVSINVDAMPGHAVEGYVESISPASGALFSLLPPDNATGNFTKIVQRLAVRISVPMDVAKRGALKAGMSVVATVDTRGSTVANLQTPADIAVK